MIYSIYLEVREAAFKTLDAKNGAEFSYRLHERLKRWLIEEKEDNINIPRFVAIFVRVSFFFSFGRVFVVFRIKKIFKNVAKVEK